MRNPTTSATAPLLPQFHSGATGLTGRFSGGFSLRRLHSNLPFDEWTSMFGSERLTGALLDRLIHHVHILELNGDSYR